MARDTLSPTPPGIKRQVDAPPGLLRQPISLFRYSAESSPKTPQPTRTPFTRLLEKPLERFRQRFVYGTSNFSLLAGDEGMAVAQEVGKRLEKEVPPNTQPFANGEKRIVIDPKYATTQDVYVIQSVMDNRPDGALRVMKHLEIAAKRAGANRIIAIFTQLPYARQDKIEQPGAVDAARNVLQEMQDAGSHNYRKKKHQSRVTTDASIMTVEVHSEDPLKEVESDSNLQWANLNSAFVLVPKLREVISENQLDPVIAFPDEGALGRFGDYVPALTPNLPPAYTLKERDIHQNNKTRITGMVGDVDGKDVILVDDILDTGGTIRDAAREFKKHGARTVRVIATHGVFSNDALEKMNDEAIDGIIITDTIPPRQEVLDHPKIEVVPIAPLIAETIRRIENREPLGEVVKSTSKDFEKSYRKIRVNTERRKVAKRERQARRTKADEYSSLSA